MLSIVQVFTLVLVFAVSNAQSLRNKDIEAMIPVAQQIDFITEKLVESNL
jgi:hypothetical protein